MDKYNTDIIFTHHPFDTHQAHVGVSNATIAAARRKNTVFFYEPITPSGRSYVAFRPQLYVRILLIRKMLPYVSISLNITNLAQKIGLLAYIVDVDLEDMRSGRNMQRHLRCYVLKQVFLKISNYNARWTFRR